jgi:hypothetical protein
MSRPIAKHQDGSNCYTKNCSIASGHSATYATNSPSQAELAKTATNTESARLLKDVNKRLYDCDYVYKAPKESKISTSAILTQLAKAKTPEAVVKATHMALTMLDSGDQRAALHEIAKHPHIPMKLLARIVRYAPDFQTVLYAVNNSSLQDKDRIALHKKIVESRNNFQKGGLGLLGEQLLSKSSSSKLLEQVAQITHPDTDSRIIDHPHTSFETLAFIADTRVSTSNARRFSRLEIVRRFPEHAEKYDY